jgi:hypothetical protein
MIPDDKMEPIRDEQGGTWQFYKGNIPGIDEQYSYTLQLPSTIHNYIVDRYIGTDEQGPLPGDFSFTPQMVEDITRQWKTMGEEWPLDMATFRASLEETKNHRYHIEASESPFDDLVEQRENVINEPLDIDQEQPLEEPAPPLDEKGNPIDIEEIYQAIDEGRLGDMGPEHGDDFVRQDLLEPVSLNFGQSVKDVADYMKEKAGGLEQAINNDMTDTFGR